MKHIVTILTLAQAFLAIRVIARFGRTARSERIERTTAQADQAGRVSVLVPVLNEATRLGPCLDGLIAQGEAVSEILVIDGGSTDGTRDLVRSMADRDARLTLVDAAPVPEAVNGKAHNLQAGLDRASPDACWILTIDADVRPHPLLARSLVAHASRRRLVALSVATRQRLSGTAEGLLHPSMLATLVYRFGIPGHATASVSRVQANGQCFLVRRDALAAAGGFAAVSRSVCEDVTLARLLASRGHAVGFYESDDLATVEMYAGWRDAWDNWSRSLPLRDRFSGRSGRLGLVEVLAVQALPVPTALILASLRVRHPATLLNLVLVWTRFGVLAGMARAYEERPWTYWLSPLADLPVSLHLWAMARRRQHTWRGRTLIAGDTA